MSASYLRKYGTGTGADVYINIPKAGSANHAVGADWTPAAGDVKISKDGGAAANIGTLPTAIAMGNSAIWKFVFTDAELQAKFISITVADSATKAVDDTGFSIETYGNASGLHAFDLNTATQSVNVTQFGGSNGTFAAGRPEVNASHWAGAATATDDVALAAAPTNFAALAITAGGAVTAGTVSDKTGYRLSATGVDDILDEVCEGSTTLRQLLRGFAAALLAKASGLATTTAVYRDIGDTKARITATVDANGNRSAVTLDLT